MGDRRELAPAHQVMAGWVLTLVIVGCTSAAFFAQGAYAPGILDIDDRNALAASIEQNSMAMIQSLNQTAFTAGNPALSDEIEMLNDSLARMIADPEEELYAQHVPAADSC